MIINVDTRSEYTAGYTTNVYPFEVSSTYQYVNDVKSPIILTFKNLSDTLNYDVDFLASNKYVSDITHVTIGNLTQEIHVENNTTLLHFEDIVIADNEFNVSLDISGDGTYAHINALVLISYPEPKEGSKKSSNELFPNPVKSILHVDVGSIPTSVTIYTSDGRQVKTCYYKTDIDVSALPKGIYIALVKIPTSTISRVFIKI